MGGSGEGQGQVLVLGRVARGPRGVSVPVGGGAGAWPIDEAVNVSRLDEAVNVSRLLGHMRRDGVHAGVSGSWIQDAVTRGLHPSHITRDGCPRARGTRR